jgi:ppGpp synthetase/RelA/SpoT-type nucleotidyltranferase
VIPASLTASVGDREPFLAVLCEYMVSRLESELKEVAPVAVVSRIKSAQSMFQKLQTGVYQSIGDVRDAVGLKVVMLYRSQVATALDVVANCGLQVNPSAPPMIAPTDLRYREPKLCVKPPTEYLVRHPELEPYSVEVQFTTALQHALDMATHDFDYKGTSYSWGNVRLVAQLRGTLELVDKIIDDIEVSAVLAETVEAEPEEFTASRDILIAVEARFQEEILPPDRRRMASTIHAWCIAAGVAPAELGQLLDRHPDLVDAMSLDPASAVLGALLREESAALIGNFAGRFCITQELESLCHEAAAVSELRRVSFAAQATRHDE